jgi:hypothetical protein
LFVCYRNEGSGFDFGELEEAIVLQGIKSRNDETKACKFNNFPFISNTSFSDIR